MKDKDVAEFEYEMIALLNDDLFDRSDDPDYSITNLAKQIAEAARDYVQRKTTVYCDADECRHCKTVPNDYGVCTKSEILVHGSNIGLPECISVHTRHNNGKGDKK